MQVIDILLIDDNKEYCRSLRNRFLQIGEDIDLNIQVKDFQNLEDGFAELEKDSKYKALILDAKALITTDQETADLNFLPVALHRLEKLNQKTGRIHTPFAAITGYYDNFLSFDTLIEEQKGKLFDKTSQEEDMFQYLLSEIKNTENKKIEKQYADVFEIFDKGYLDSKYRVKLINVLSNIDDASKANSILQDLRVIQDEIYNALNRKDENIVPSTVSKWNNRKRIDEDVSPSFGDKNKHLSGNEESYKPTTTVYQTPTISFFANTIYRVSSSFGSHASPKPSNVTVEYWEMPSSYAVKSLVFALLEQLLWFAELMRKP
jgi:hypothetical protein